MAGDGGRARLLDELAAAATAAREEAAVAGWWCKASPDLPFRRASAALPPIGAGSDGAACAASLAQVRAWCAARGQRTIVQVSSADPAVGALDALLAVEGLVVEAPVHVMVAGEPSQGIGGGVGELSVVAGVDEAWVEASALLADADDHQQERALAYGRMLVAHDERAIGASLRVDGVVAGIGFGVVDRGWLGTFGMATAPAWRRRGVASSVLAGLRGHAAQVGARASYLQVEVDNEPAIRLYGRVGFVRSHGYHYRSEALGGAGG